MNKYLFSVVFSPMLAVGIPTYAETLSEAPADTLPTVELQEVVVKGRTQRVIDHGVEYIPDKRTKHNSLDAVNLLEKMQIPQLFIDPMTSEVKTSGRDDVTFYIDYHPATSEQLKGMRTEDVLRVEVLDYPTDSRFDGALHVINYIMQQYEWGGYTRIGADTHFLADNDFVGSLFSRMVYKNWTFDASAYGDYGSLNRCPGYSSQIFRKVEFLGKHFDEIHRESYTDRFKSKYNAEGASFRFTYQKDNKYITHSVSFNRNANPFREEGMNVNFSIPDLSDTESITKSSTQSVSPSVSGYYWFQFPKQNYLSANWSFSYGYNKRYSTYAVGDFDPILNNNREKVYSPSLNVVYTKMFPRQNTLRMMLYSYCNVYNTGYSGSYDTTQKLISNENMYFLEYMKQWSFGLSLYSRLGVSYVQGRVNNALSLSEWNPRLGFQLQYRINDKNSASFEGWWGNNHPEPSSANDALVQSSELMWLKGNPDLRNTIFTTLKAGYTFIPTNNLSLSANLDYQGNPHRQAYRYFTIPGKDGVVRQVVNSGTAYQYTGYLSGTLKLFDNALSISANGQFARCVLTGIDRQQLNYISGMFNVQYMGENWSVRAYYSTPSSSLHAWSYGTVYKWKDTYGIAFSYVNGNLKGEVKFNNWFRKDNLTKSIFNSPHYSEISYNWGSNTSRIVEIGLTYTFSYGKKVNRNNEGGVSEGAGSAILK